VSVSVAFVSPSLPSFLGTAGSKACPTLFAVAFRYDDETLPRAGFEKTGVGLAVGTKVWLGVERVRRTS